MKEFKLDILTPERKFFSGEVQSLTVNTTGGEIGILPNTLPLVAGIESGIMRILQKNKWIETVNSSGFIQVSDQGVIILVEACEWPHEIDFASLDKKIDAQAEQLKKKQSLQEYKLAKAQLQMQFAKLKIRSKSGD